MTRALARLLALTAVWAGVELLERVAYAAGVDDAAAVLVRALDDVDEDLADVDEDLADVDEDLADVEPFDVTDVLGGHLVECVCCATGAATWPPA